MQCVTGDECCSGRCIAKDDGTSRCARKTSNPKKKGGEKKGKHPASGPWVYSTQFGSYGSGDSNFQNPAGVALSADGLTLWVADYQTHRITIWTRPNANSTNWTYNAQFGNQGDDDTGLLGPYGVAVSPDGLTVWVADTSNSRIVIWTRPDSNSTTWSYNARFGTRGTGDAQFRTPTGVAISPDTLTAWVADPNNDRITIWTRQTGTSTEWTYSAKFGTIGSGNTNLAGASDVAISADTLTAWVADQSNSRIVVWSRVDANATEWNYSTQFGSDGSGDNNFYGPFGVAISADTRTAWVADVNNNRISVWTRPDSTSLSWSYSTQFGSYGSGDTNFNRPYDVAVSAAGDTAWVPDNFNSRIVVWKRI